MIAALIVGFLTSQLVGVWLARLVGNNAAKPIWSTAKRDQWVSELSFFPLIVTMLVAIFAVHLPYGWQAIADASAPFANERVMGSVEKIARARELLKEHGNYDWLTSSGKLVVLNNGIEFAATYLVMLVALFFSGAGRWISLDFWLDKALRRQP